MFDRAGSPAEPSRGVTWTYLSLFSLLPFTLGCLIAIVIVTRDNSRPELIAETNPLSPAAPGQIDVKAETEVDIETEVKTDTWRVVLDNTHDVKDAANAGIAPDEQDAVIFPGGELALAYGDADGVVDGAGDDLSVYGTAGDKTPYTVFVRSAAADRWIHLAANRSGFPQGVGSHDIRQQRVRQIKIRNDGTTSLFVDAVGVVRRPGAATTDRAAIARSRTDRAKTSPPAPAAEVIAAVPLREPATRSPVSVPASEASRVEPQTEASVPAHTTPEPQAAPISPPAGAAATVEGPVPSARPRVEGKRPTLELPQRIRRVPPQYPNVAKMAHVKGTVVIEAILGVDGRVTTPRVVKSVPLLDQAALDAVEQWEFKPAMRDGRPVPVTVKLSVEFTLP